MLAGESSRLERIAKTIGDQGWLFLEFDTGTLAAFGRISGSFPSSVVLFYLGSLQSRVFCRPARQAFDSLVPTPAPFLRIPFSPWKIRMLILSLPLLLSLQRPGPRYHLDPLRHRLHDRLQHALE